jgi:hypothetical protein
MVATCIRALLIVRFDKLSANYDIIKSMTYPLVPSLLRYERIVFKGFGKWDKNNKTTEVDWGAYDLATQRLWLTATRYLGFSALRSFRVIVLMCGGSWVTVTWFFAVAQVFLGVRFGGLLSGRIDHLQ